MKKEVYLYDKMINTNIKLQLEGGVIYNKEKEMEVRMTRTLKEAFPMIRDRIEVRVEIEKREELQRIFYSWSEERQNEFLDFCTGVRGIKFLYDSFFKEILNPEYAPERQEELLTLLLGIPVKILEALPADSTRIADESSLLIMDIVVQLGSGSIVNLEVQKIGYKFPGSRSACYSADLLLRQYKRVRSRTSRQKQTFSYKDIKEVYTIVLFERSPLEFHAFPNHYQHYFCQKSNTGLDLNLLQQYLFIPLDIFRKNQHNKDKKIENKLEAWLTFLSVDDPEMILHLIEEYPEFRPMYEEAYRLCLNIEEVMQMFSKELAELDRNTVQLMIDEMQDEIDSQKQQLESKDQVICEQKQKIHGMIALLYQTIKDPDQLSALTGMPIEEVRAALADLQSQTTE